MSLVLLFSLCPSTAFANPSNRIYKDVSEQKSNKASRTSLEQNNSSKSSTAELAAYPIKAKIQTRRLGAKRSRTTWTNTTAGKAKGKPIVALGISAVCNLGGSITYKAYLKGKGWSKIKSNGKAVRGKGKYHPLQAVRISLKGPLASYYDIHYKVYLNGYGWSGWGKSGAAVGAPKLANITGLKVYFSAKGSKAPGKTSNAFFADGKKSGKKFIRRAAKSRKQIIKAVNSAKRSGLHCIGEPYNLNSKAGKRLKRAIKRLKGFKLSFVMIDLYSGNGISYNPSKVIYGASVTKGPYVAAINKFSSKRSTFGSRSLITQTIRFSSNDAYKALRSRYGSACMARMLRYCGVSSKEMSPGKKYPHLTSKTLAKMWVGTYWSYFHKPSRSSKWARSLYRHSRNSFIDQALNIPVYTKAGWYFEKYDVHDDAGIVMVNGHPYLVSILSSAFGHTEKLRNLVKAIHLVHKDLI